MSGTQTRLLTGRWRTYLPWLLAAVVSALAIVVWGQSFDWTWQALNAYMFFPVLGLLAFSLMWTHYMVGTLRGTFFEDAPVVNYVRYTGYVVLAAIVLHPGILIYQLWHDGFGLPPGSYMAIVGRGMEWLVLLGTASLFAFLAFELKRWFEDRSWWKYIDSASDVAMIAILYHGLRLGAQLQGGWYRTIWFVYGVTLVAALARKYILRLSAKGDPSKITR